MLEVQPCVVYEDILPTVGIMQTEEADAKEVDEISNRVIEELEPDMTVKEELEEPQPIVCECSPSSILPEECLAPDSLEVHETPFCESDEFIHNSLRPDCAAALVVPCPTPHCLDELVTSAEGQASPLTSFSLPDQQRGDRGRGRGRRRSRWKLKFHHQALPPEYLDHYEAAMAQQDAAAKSTASDKPETKPRPPSSTTKALPPLVPRSVMTEKKFDNLLHLIKKEQEAGKFGPPQQPPLLRNLCPPDQLQFMPISTAGVGGENELLSRLQQNFQRCRTEDSAAADKMTVNDKRTSVSDNISQGKGLLGSLLSSNVSPEISIKACSEADRKKRSSVIMSNCTSTNLNRANTPAATTAPTTSRVMKYQDLPYMGEITLDNTKPRRGRKPKKADICHLIYKNYGTIFPGAPNQNAAAESEDALKMKAQGAPFTSTCHTNSKIYKKDSPVPTGIKCRPLDSLKSSPPINHADVQNRIISSLLEKRLTAASMDAKRNALSLENAVLRRGHTESINTTNSNSMAEPWINNKHVIPPSDGTDEPLNLCIKDLNQLKIRLLRKHGNFYEPRSNNNIIVKSEPNSPSELEQLELRDSPKETMSKFSDDAESTGTGGSRNQTPLPPRQLDHENSLPFPPINIPAQFANPSLLPTDAINPITSGYVYWPNAGVFVHPMALQSQLLYYQKMGAIPLLPVPPVEQSPTFIPSPIAPNTLIPNLPAMMAAQRNDDAGDSHAKEHPRPTAPCIKSSLPKGFSSILHTKPPEMPSELSFPRLKRLAPLGNLPPVGSSLTTKRKRSAIFIPPMPSENNNNPTTEVSICKFKFTGGAKPSLQEKKMLSVDSGGNFRYYSGTGDKSMRGYEFFPRESLQPSSATSNATPSENFFAASTMGSCESASPNSQQLGHSSTFMDKGKTNFPASDIRLGHQIFVPGFNEGILDALHSDNIMKHRETGENQLEHHNVGADFNKKFGVGSEAGGDESCSSQFKTRRKRKTRKSLAREKLEQTFKEKGFLIQTQQLESAEGATYCKFRQLRKFTRYLFRSWKDYLPGNVREMSVAAGVGGSGTTPLQRDLEVEGELSSNSPHSNQETTEVVQQPPAE